MDTFLYQYVHSFTAILMAAFYFIVRIYHFFYLMNSLLLDIWDVSGFQLFK